MLMKTYIAALVLILGISVTAQMKQRVSGVEAERQWHEEQELGDLYKRAAASRFVVVGTVLKDSPIGQRGKQPSIDDNVAGILHSINIDEVLCRQEDLAGGPVKSSTLTPQTINLFVPLNPAVEDRHLRKERLSARRRYLLFLVMPDQAQQKLWTDSLMLDPQLAYYRAEELSRGVVPLLDPTADNSSLPQPHVLEKVRRLCRAMRPSNLDDKLAALNQLVASHDPVMEKEAQIAINALQAPE